MSNSAPEPFETLPVFETSNVSNDSYNKIPTTNGTLFINAAVLNENYKYTNAPITIDFDFETLEYKIIT